MHNEDAPLDSNAIPIFVAAQCYLSANFGNSCCNVETDLRLRCAYTPRSYFELIAEIYFIRLHNDRESKSTRKMCWLKPSDVARSEIRYR